ncbi:hypothetical protein [Streptomyces sp. NPDC054849]
MYPSLFTTPGLAKFAEEVDAERGRQLAKFGDQRHRDGTSIGNANWAQEALAQCQQATDEDCLTWGHILYEEFTEVMAETDPARLRAELLQVAAVCAAWVSDLDRRPAAVVDDGLPPELLVTASGDHSDGTYKPALCGCGNPTHSPLVECPPPVHWTVCTPDFLAITPGACQTLPRLPGDGVSVSHYHPQPERP